MLLIPLHAIAASDPPPAVVLAHSPDVLLAKVDSIKDGKITFSVIETLKGKSPGSLSLTPGITQDFKPGDETILCRLGYASMKGEVSGTLLDGIPEWECLEVDSKGGKITVWGIGSLEKVKKICASKSP